MFSLVIKPIGEEDTPSYDLLLSADPSELAIQVYLPYSTIYQAYIEERLIGQYVFFPVDNHEAEIKNIAVDEAYQGQGIGKLLLQDAIQRAISSGYKILSIGTSNASIGQLYLYQKQGFELSGIKMNFFIDNYSEPLYENGIQCKHMIMLTKELY
ncbi:N-acetyltransferase [Emticicia sp. BO119]|uniref:GNAT family N-acetyltransferase n=1 Tax=Emticicia sp. BO119 TaxID=2757768 RepID=UPI0015EFF7CB|nr:GNAT family N-acetyltransferase [Emticicia sp. BO119]MBA4849828.1 GNAT family N-acetyltransferase [Emticicia sp. BO119]